MDEFAKKKKQGLKQKNHELTGTKIIFKPYFFYPFFLLFQTREIASLFLFSLSLSPVSSKPSNPL
jgi:hypothetical protein